MQVAGNPYLFTPPSPPATPTGFNVVFADLGYADLGWTDTADETGFIIERTGEDPGDIGNPDNASWVVAGYHAMNATTYTDSGIAPAGTYFWRISATNGVGPSSPSAPISSYIG
jgi:hypothetical protein